MNQDENGIGNPKTISEIYEELSAINVNEHLEKKGNLDFLNWARSVGMIKQIDPGFRFWFKTFNGKGVQKYPADGEGFNTTCEVLSIINCCGYEFEMHLPVMDFRNKAIVNPTSRDINDCKMRALVKNISINLGLGAYVFQGYKAPGQLKLELENGSQSSSDTNSFAPMNTTDSTGSQKIVVTATDSVSVVASPNGQNDVGNSIVLIGFGAGKKTYSEVYGTNTKNIDSQIEWVKSNGNGDKASEHLANLCQYKLMLTSRV